MKTFILVCLALVLLCLTAPIWLPLIALGYLLDNRGGTPVTWPAAPVAPRPAYVPQLPDDDWATDAKSIMPPPATPGAWRPYLAPPEGLVLALSGQEAEAAAAAGLQTEWVIPGGDLYYLRMPAPRADEYKFVRRLPDDGLPF